MYTLALAQEEILKHKAELIHKSNLTDEQFAYLIQLIFAKMSLVSSRDIEPFRDRATGIMMDIDIADSPFLALAMLLDAPIWSNDTHFKRQNAARILTTKDILFLLGI